MHIEISKSLLKIELNSRANSGPKRCCWGSETTLFCCVSFLSFTLRWHWCRPRLRSVGRPPDRWDLRMVSPPDMRYPDTPTFYSHGKWENDEPANSSAPHFMTKPYGIIGLPSFGLRKQSICSTLVGKKCTHTWPLGNDFLMDT